MAQISIQLDALTLKALEITASKNHIPVSQWIKNRIRSGLKEDWPEDYFSVFGSLDDEDLLEPTEIPFEYESKRERL